jgi:ABC-type uncharacterized transport system auxiliary subunit
MNRATCLALSLIAAGCFGTTYTPALRYALEPVIQVNPAPPTELTLGIRPLNPARPYQEKIAYRDTDYVLGYYEGAEWAEYPRDVATRALTDAIEATGHFRDVGHAGDIHAPNLVLTGQLRKFEELRNATTPVALCEVHLELRESLGGKMHWSATLSGREPLEQQDLAALAAAMSRAIARIAEEAAAQIVRATP